MDKMIITETVNGVTNYISLNEQGQLVSVDKNPMELPGLMTKEQAFKVVTALRQANKDEDVKYRVKAASQALRDYVTDLILNKLPEMPMVDEAVSDKAIESWKPKVTAKADEKAETEPAAEESGEAETKTINVYTVGTKPDGQPGLQQIDAVEVPAETETKPAKKAKKQSK